MLNSLRQNHNNMDVNSNKYTYVFALIMVIVVAALLSGTSIALKDRQEANVRQEKQQDILKSIGVILTRPEAEAQFDDYIKERLVIKNGASVDSEVAPFDINMADAVALSAEEREVPLYVAEKDGSTYYIVPLRGKGLWGPIWGYISLEEDGSTVYGATFGHKGETPGLGAEIATDMFQDKFQGKQIMDGGDFVSVAVIKGIPSGDYQVDGISGGTITSDGVDDMLEECLKPYIGYFQSTMNTTALNAQ